MREDFYAESNSTEETVEKKETTQKTREKTREKILALIKENPEITTTELAASVDLTVKGIEWQIKQLKEKGIIRRVGADKGGHWEVL